MFCGSRTQQLSQGPEMLCWREPNIWKASQTSPMALDEIEPFANLVKGLAPDLTDSSLWSWHYGFGEGSEVVPPM